METAAGGLDYKISNLNLSLACTKKLASSKHYGVLFIRRGDAVFSWSDGNAACGSESIVLMKPGSTVFLRYQGVGAPLEAIFIQVAPQTLSMLSDETTNLDIAFNIVPFVVASLHIDNKTLMLCKNLASQLSLMSDETCEFAHSIFERNLLAMLMVLLLRGCMHAEHRQRKKSRRHLYIDDVFAYIAANISEELPLEKLEQVFYVSKSHLAREFKRKTGETLHSYIVKAKLDYCLPYIAAGHSIAEVYKMSGFGGYNHFFRAFKQQYGISPKTYYRNTCAH